MAHTLYKILLVSMIAGCYVVVAPPGQNPMPNCDPGGAQACVFEDVGNDTFNNRQQCIRAMQSSIDCMQESISGCESPVFADFFDERRWSRALEYACDNWAAVLAGVMCIPNQWSMIGQCIETKAQLIQDKNLDLSKRPDLEKHMCWSIASGVVCTDDSCGINDEFTTFYRIMHKPGCTEEPPFLKWMDGAGARMSSTLPIFWILITIGSFFSHF